VIERQAALMLNNVLKIAALLCFVGSLGVIVYRVPDVILAVVLIIVIAMATYDFLVRPWLFRNGNNKHPR
jgi:uncharacterized membrane protein YbaN (DUF454 family)